MMTRTERQNVEVEITNFKSYLKGVEKELPKNKLVYDLTVIFFRKILGYHIAPIYINSSSNRNVTLLFKWQAYILNELEVFDEASFERINENYHDVDTIPLEDLRSYIRKITGRIEK